MKTKTVQAPVFLPVFGRAKLHDVSLLGWTDHVGDDGRESARQLFGMWRNDRRQHMLISGRQYTGKSTLMQALIRQDIANNRPVIAILENWHDVEMLLASIPTEHAKRFRFFDFAKSRQLPFQYCADPGTVKVFARGLAEYITERKTELQHHFEGVQECIELVVLGVINEAMITTNDLQSIERTMAELEPGQSSRAIDLIHKNEVAKELLEVLRVVFSEVSVIKALQGLQKKKQAKPYIPSLIIYTGDSLGIQLDRSLHTRIFELFLACMVKYRQAHGGPLFYVYIDNPPFISEQAWREVFDAAFAADIAITMSVREFDAVPENIQKIIHSRVASYISFQLTYQDAQHLRIHFSPGFDARDLTSIPLGKFYASIIINQQKAPPFTAEIMEVFDVEDKGFLKQTIKSS